MVTKYSKTEPIVPFEVPDIQLNSKLFNPNRRKSKVEEANQLRDLKYQYVQKDEDARKVYKAQRQFSSKDTQIKFSKYRDSAAFLMLYKKTFDVFNGTGANVKEVKEEYEESQIENERAKQKVMTIEEMIGDFTNEN